MMTITGTAEQIDAAWRMLRRQDLIHSARLVTDDGIQLQAFRGDDGRWQLLTADGIWRA